MRSSTEAMAVAAALIVSKVLLTALISTSCFRMDKETE